MDGRTFIGTLTAVDNTTNLVLSETIERIIWPEDDERESSEQEQGLYVIRGDHVVIVGLVDEETDKQIDWTEVRGETIGSTKHV